MINKIIIIIALVIIQPFAQAKTVDYSLPDINGQMQSFDQYRGKWIVASFWATWCHTCIKEMPDLIKFHEKSKDSDVVVVGINFESIEQAQLKEFVLNKSIPYTILKSEPLEKTPLGIVPALPTTYIIDPEGNIVGGEIGLLPSEAIENFISLKKQQRLNSTGS